MSFAVDCRIYHCRFYITKILFCRHSIPPFIIFIFLHLFPSFIIHKKWLTCINNEWLNVPYAMRLKVMSQSLPKQASFAVILRVCLCVCSLSFCLSLFPFCLPASALLSFIQSTLIHYYLKRTKLINCRRCCCPFSFAFVYLDNPFSVGLGKEEKNDEKREIEIGHC